MIELTIIGHLGQNAEVKHVENAGNKKVINFSVAHTEKWKDKENVSQSRTIWVECAYWTEKPK